MSDAELNPMVRLLIELEQPFDQDRHYDFAPDELGFGLLGRQGPGLADLRLPHPAG